MFPKYYLFFYFFLCSGDGFNFCTLLQRWADSILHKIVPKISFISEFSRLIRSTLTIFFVLLWNLKSFRKHFRENSSLYSCCLKNVTRRTTYSGGGGEGKVVLSWVLFRKTRGQILPNTEFRTLVCVQRIIIMGEFGRGFVRAVIRENPITRVHCTLYSCCIDPNYDRPPIRKIHEIYAAGQVAHS